jgi:4-hydroxy-3-polyprenylbenzoate decarboxylase
VKLDLRQWLANVTAIGELEEVRGAAWDLEIGAISWVNYRKSGYKALLFSHILGHRDSYRILTGATGSCRRLATTFRIPGVDSDLDLVNALQGRPLAWEQASAHYPPAFVSDGPVFENVAEGKDVDLWAFPVPRWHEHDGGRYIGTGSAVITQDPDSGIYNVGSYRLMVVDDQRVTVNIAAGKHGRINYEKWWRKEGRCPLLISVGHDPLLFCLAGTEVPTGVSELSYCGAVLGEPVEVIRSQLTGLPIPATSEIVLEGWITPENRAKEGPFGEWTGYYADSQHSEPVLEVERLLYRDSPTILGSPPSMPPHDFSYFRTVFKSAMIRDALVKAGIPDVRGVWTHECGGGRQFVVVSIKQRYCGHARQAGFVASQCDAAAYMGKYVVVVDDDIDPSCLDEVIWAMCFRCDPAQDIDFIRKAWGGRVDPLCFDHSRTYNSRAVIDACVPLELKDRMPLLSRLDPALAAATEAKWSMLWRETYKP